MKNARTTEAENINQGMLSCFPLSFDNVHHIVSTYLVNLNSVGQNLVRFEVIGMFEVQFVREFRQTRFERFPKCLGGSVYIF